MEKVVVWRTQHPISDTVARAIGKMLSTKTNVCLASVDDSVPRHYLAPNTIHIGYGILRGMADVQQIVTGHKLPFFYVDKGYFGANHYDGYYRLSIGDTQTSYNRLPEAPHAGFKIKFKIDALRGGECLVCPPTDHVQAFHGVRLTQWLQEAEEWCERHGMRMNVRHKNDERELAPMLERAKFVYTHNSSLGWIALARGTPALATWPNALLGPLQKTIDSRKSVMVNIPSDEILAKAQANQFRLGQDQAEALWAMMTSQLFTLAMTAGKP